MMNSESLWDLHQIPNNSDTGSSELDNQISTTLGLFKYEQVPFINFNGSTELFTIVYPSDYKGTGKDYVREMEIDPYDYYAYSIPRYTTSLDAAISLVEQMLTGCLIRQLRNEDNIATQATIIWMPDGLAASTQIKSVYWHQDEKIALIYAMLDAKRQLIQIR